MSSLILPRMLGLFTVVITFEQQKLTRQQRLEYKDKARLQRELQWNISQIALATEREAASDRYRNEVFSNYIIAYIKEIEELLKENNGSLTSNSFTHKIARIKTVNAIQYLLLRFR